MTRSSLKQQYGVSASGGTNKTQATMSLNFLNNDGIVVNTNFKRLTARVNMVSKVNDFLEVGSQYQLQTVDRQGQYGV